MKRQSARISRKERDLFLRNVEEMRGKLMECMRVLGNVEQKITLDCRMYCVPLYRSDEKKFTSIF